MRPIKLPHQTEEEYQRDLDIYERHREEYESGLESLDESEEADWGDDFGGDDEC